MIIETWAIGAIISITIFVIAIITYTSVAKNVLFFTNFLLFALMGLGSLDLYYMSPDTGDLCHKCLVSENGFAIVFFLLSIASLCLGYLNMGLLMQQQVKKGEKLK